MNRFADSAWTSLASAAGRQDVLLVPVGATEQHGPHLPVTTDTDIAVAVAEMAAWSDPGTVIAPPLSYGASGEHQGFAGTLSIGQDATELVLVELCRSATVDFTAVVLVSTHGGNVDPLRRAVRRLDEERRPVRWWMPSWKGDLHAGRTETSLMLAVAPDRVDLGRAEPGDRRSGAELLDQLRRHGVRSVSANGVLGDPAGASAEEGTELLCAAGAELASVTRMLRCEVSVPATGTAAEDPAGTAAGTDHLGSVRTPREGTRCNR